MVKRYYIQDYSECSGSVLMGYKNNSLENNLALFYQ